MKTNVFRLVLLAFFLNACSPPPISPSPSPSQTTIPASPTVIPTRPPTDAPLATATPAGPRVSGRQPPGCVEPDLVYDSMLERVLLLNCFSQPSNTELPIVIWSWNGQSWEVVDDHGPAGRVVTGAAFDSRRGVLVTYGGQPLTSADCTRETWEWDHQSWIQKDANSPSQCDHFKMTYDASLGTVLLFGGQAEHLRPVAETWSWNGEQWQQVSDSGPASRAHFGLVYDDLHQQALLYGGLDGGVHNDFWSWREGAWQAIVLPGPGRRSHLGMAFDDKTGVLLIFGGAKTNSTFSSMTDETWVLDGDAWEQRSGPAPSPRGSPGLAYDPLREKIVLYGGFSPDQQELADTWEWDGQTWICTANC